MTREADGPAPLVARHLALSAIPVASGSGGAHDAASSRTTSAAPNAESDGAVRRAFTTAGRGISGGFRTAGSAIRGAF